MPAWRSTVGPFWFNASQSTSTSRRLGRIEGVGHRADQRLMAERRRSFFAALTKRRLKRGAFGGGVDLQAAFNRFLDDHNANPFRWRADPDKIIAAASRGHQTLDSIH
jgi:hypothetical protein